MLGYVVVLCAGSVISKVGYFGYLCYILVRLSMFTWDWVCYSKFVNVAFILYAIQTAGPTKSSFIGALLEEYLVQFSPLVS